MSNLSIDLIPNDRRKLLKSFLVLPLLGVIPSAMAEEKHHHHHHGNKHAALAKSALDCIHKGELCLSHCMELFKVGDTSVAECADSVQEMLTMCNALVDLAAHDSNYLVEFTKICEKVCTHCEKECRKHEDDHPECKACAESCVVCADECKKVYQA